MAATAWSQRGRYGVAQVDVYSGRAFGWAEVVSEVLQRADKPFILTLHGGNLPAFARRWPRRMRRVLAGASQVTTPSEYLRTELREYREEIRVVQNALEIGMYSFNLRRAPGPRLIWLRAFHETYNPTLAPRVVARLLAAGVQDLELIMIGPDKGDGSLARARAVAAKLSVSKHLLICEGIRKAEVPTAMQRGDIFLNTSNVDNTPISVLEAMACGLCVVSTNVGGIPYLVENEHDGLLVPPDDPEAMKIAVHRLLTEPELAKKLSENARAKAERCDWSVVLPEWEALLKSAVTLKHGGRTNIN
jgi:glycosyltransferase involved in cell wall biosynthesis